MQIAKIFFFALQTESTGAWDSGWRRGSSTPTLKGTVVTQFIKVEHRHSGIRHLCPILSTDWFRHRLSGICLAKCRRVWDSNFLAFKKTVRRDDL
jgi:hypothetical protein